MSFNSVDFLLFFPIVALIYYLIPTKTRVNGRSVWLLIASYYFYMSWNPKYAILIMVSTCITYMVGIFIDRNNDKHWEEITKIKHNKILLTIGLLSNLLILVLFKYGNFVIDNISQLLSRLHIVVNIPSLNMLLPVGISFYTFQALGYIIDVYRGNIKAERSFIQYALFVSFFPQLVAGPIERSGNLIHQLREEHKFDLDNVREGLLVMLWGFFMKIVIADRVAVFVDTVFMDYDNYIGTYLIVATLLFCIQIYCDFNGYTMIARGAAKIMGFDLIENFEAPFLARSISEFWRRWHMSLTGWFRDYLYIPLGGSKKGKPRKYINIIIVFAVSGLWHGAAWTFILWGVLNGIYQIIGEILMPFRCMMIKKFRLNSNSLSHKIVCALFTDALFAISMVFFRSRSVKEGITILKSIFTTYNPWILTDHESIYHCGLDRQDFGLLIFALLVLFIVDIAKTKKISIMKDVLFKQDTWCRWVVYIVGFMFVFIFGVWGSEYVNTTFLYFQF